MKATPVENFEVPSLFSWHVNIYKLNNRKHILFVNDCSRLCVIVDGVRTGQGSQLIEKFRTTLKQYLVSEGIEEGLVNSYLKEGSDIQISKTNSRSVLGTMNEITMFKIDDEEDNMKRLKWLNRMIYKPIDYHEPIKVFIEAITNEYPSNV